MKSDGKGRVGERKMGGERFTYRITTDGKVFVRWHGGGNRREVVLSGSRATKLIAALLGMDHAQEQLALARATGNERAWG